MNPLELQCGQADPLADQQRQVNRVDVCIHRESSPSAGVAYVADTAEVTGAQIELVGATRQARGGGPGAGQGGTVRTGWYGGI